MMQKLEIKLSERKKRKRGIRRKRTMTQSICHHYLRKNNDSHYTKETVKAEKEGMH
jgi:hypothetical protein